MLFRQVSEIAKFVEIDPNILLDKLRPSIEAAETFVAKNILSVAQMDALQSAFGDTANDNELSAGNLQLLNYVRPVVANYMMERAIPGLQVQVSGAGTHIQSNEQRKTAFAWQIEQACRLYRRAGDVAADALFEMLEANKLSYPTWAGSAQYTEFKSMFVFTTEQFNAYQNIGMSRTVFLAVRHHMKYVQEQKVKNILGEDYYDSLLAEVNSGSVSADNAKVLAFLRPAIVHGTVAEALTELTVVIDEDGLLVRTSTSTEIPQVKNQVANERLTKLIDSSRNKHEMYLRDMITFLNANASGSVYADYYNSDKYVAPSEDTPFTNTNTSGINMF